MADTTEENPLEKIKEEINEVIELLNEPYRPVAVNDEDAEAESGPPKE